MGVTVQTIFHDWDILIFHMEWSVHTFFAAMLDHRIALIPIEVNEFTRVEANNRIALSLSPYLGGGGRQHG